MHIDGAPQLPFTEAVSFQIDCADQSEADHDGEKLPDGGHEVECEMRRAADAVPDAG